MRIIYTIGIWFYAMGVRLAALFGHRKARLMAKGWRHWRDELAGLDERSVVWFHASSLGEFEQARPVIERYLELHPDVQLLLTFFSPSGLEVRKNYPKAQVVCYLPPDLPYTVFWFVIRLIDLKAAFFVKYDFWFNYLKKLHSSDIPTYLFSSIFRPSQYFFKPWGRWYLRQIKECYTHIFVQNEESLQLLRSHGIEQCSIAGDTRFDRVHQIAVAAEHDEVVEAFLRGHDGKVLVAGSTWPPDEELIAKLDAGKSRLKIILAPHVISEEHLHAIEKLFPTSVRYSTIKGQIAQNTPITPAEILIIDNIGLLSKLYRYATVAYIGGGFGVGIHNILEAVTFGKPVLFGPNYHKFQEARDILACGGGMCHRNYDELEQHLCRLLDDSEAYNKASDACLTYMQQNLGSTDKILSTIES